MIKKCDGTLRLDVIRRTESKKIPGQERSAEEVKKGEGNKKREELLPEGIGSSLTFADEKGKLMPPEKHIP